MERSSLLIADGNRDVCSHLKLLFSEMFGSIDCAADGIAAIKLFRRHVYHLVILDAMLPVADGRTVCRQICKMSDVPVVIISERSALPERLSAYRSGAEDYIVKPFSLVELDARVRAHLRREARHNFEAQVKFSGDLTIDYSERCLFFGDKRVGLAKREFDIVELLSQNPGQIFDKERIYERIWGYDSEGDSSVVAEHIRRIRTKIAAYTDHIYVETVWGCGYKWVK